MVWGSRGNPVKEAGVGGGEWWRRGLGLSLPRTQAQSPSLSQRPQIRSPHCQRTQSLRSKLGNDGHFSLEWTLYEQVAIAAMDCQHFDVAKDCLRSLRSKFPESSTVARLEGMLLEAKESWAEAQKAYAHLLEDNPLDQVLNCSSPIYPQGLQFILGAY